MAKVLVILHPDPIDGFPADYARDSISVIETYPNGQSLPNPLAINFILGHLLGSVSGKLGLRGFLEAGGHTLVVTSDKEGDDSDFDRELIDAYVVMSQRRQLCRDPSTFIRKEGLSR